MDKLNNYHFGRHVFEYFPWYKYSKDLSSFPVVNKNIANTFSFAFDRKLQPCLYAWNNNGSITVNDSTTMALSNNCIKYCGIRESVYDWEDIEKARLRLTLGTKKRAERYIKVIDTYNKYHDKILDAVYLEGGKDSIIPIINLHDFVLRDNQSMCKGIISPDDIYRFIRNNKFIGHNFLTSIYGYYNKNKMLTEKQIEAVKNILYKQICVEMSDKVVLFKIESNQINFKRIESYLKEIGLRTLSSYKTLFAYKHYELLNENIF